jgi:dipeptidyl aminopeptidase/acylaminoacyl peptidase
MRNIVIGLIAGLLTVAAADARQGEVMPLENFATYTAVSNVALSPDGEHIAIMRLTARDGDYIIEVRATDDLTAEPVRLGAERMEMQFMRWVGPEHLWVNFRQQVRDQIEGVNQGVYETKQAIVHWSGRGGFRELPDDARVVRIMRGDPDNIIIRTAGLSNETSVEDLRGQSIGRVSTPDFFRYNVQTGRQTRILRGNSRFGGFVLDQQGNPRFATELNRADRTVHYFWRPDPNDPDWREVLGFEIEDYERYGQTGINVVGFDPDNDTRAYVLAHNGENTIGAHIMNLRTGEFTRTIYQREDVDILGSRFEPHIDREPELAGFTFYADGERQYAFINQSMADLQAVVDNAFPNTRNTITACVNECAQMTVFSQSSQEPGVYYYIANGQPIVIGRSEPQLLNAAFGEQRFITYPARDGMQIPAIVTLPAFGEAPFPTVILPHGGPWVSETRAYDEWASLLSNRGYMVVQPQYRGSEGYGLQHWLASWGQWGITMSDDKDDGVRYLIEQGLTAPDQVAMFGWSYGGYAAFAAAVRQPAVYNCAIAGAGVSDLDVIQRDFGGTGIGSLLIEEGYAGMSPNDFAGDITIPLLVIHGEVDQRVPAYQSRFMLQAMERNNIPHRYVELPDADHFSNTLNFDNQLTLYTELTSWLANECGMPTGQNPAR